MAKYRFFLYDLYNLCMYLLTYEVIFVIFSFHDIVRIGASTEIILTHILQPRRRSLRNPGPPGGGASGRQVENMQKSKKDNEGAEDDVISIALGEVAEESKVCNNGRFVLICTGIAYLLTS